MGKTVLLLIFVCCCFRICEANNIDSLTAKKYTITTSLLNYVPSYTLQTRRYNIGVEVHLKKSKSIYMNIGYLYSKESTGGILKIISLGTQGVNLQIEGRHYFVKHEIKPLAAFLFMPHLLQYYTQPRLNTGYYFGLNIFGQNTKTLRQDKNRIDYHVNRNNGGLLALIGYQCQKKYWLIVDQSISLGIQFVNSKQNRNDIAVTYNGNFPAWSYSNFNNNKGVYPKLSYNFRIGF